MPAAHFPRLHPSDFRLRTLDGVADDWPITYDDLDPFFALNDQIMGVSGLAGDPMYPPNRAAWSGFARGLSLDPEAANALEDRAAREAVTWRLAERLRAFPPYAQIRRVHLTLDGWTVGNGLLTPMLKLRRRRSLGFS